MLTIFSDADLRWSNGFLIRCIRVNLSRFFQIPHMVLIFKRTLSVRLDLHITKNKKKQGPKALKKNEKKTLLTVK